MILHINENNLKKNMLHKYLKQKIINISYCVILRREIISSYFRPWCASGTQAGLPAAGFLRRSGGNGWDREHRLGRVQIEPREHQAHLQRFVQLPRGQIQNRRQRKLHRAVTRKFPLFKTSWPGLKSNN